MFKKKEYKLMVDDLQEKLIDNYELLEIKTAEVERLEKELEYYKEGYFRLIKEKESKNTSFIKRIINEKKEKSKKDENEFFFFQS